jgi:phage shock protein A
MSRLNQIDHAIARLREELRPHEQKVLALTAAIEALKRAQMARKAEKRIKPRVVKPSGEAA